MATHLPPSELEQLTADELEAIIDILEERAKAGA